VRDRLFLVGCLLYALNRWIFKARSANLFLHYYFNDVWLIPCALPPLLLLHRWLNLRDHDGPPTLAEITLHVLVWSILFEVIGPHLDSRATGDPWDVAAYAFGGAGAWIWWTRDKWWPSVTS